MGKKRGKHQHFLLAFIFIFSTIIGRSVYAQDSAAHRPTVIDNWKTYKAQVKDDSSKQMVELKRIIPGLQYELHYATTDNFMHRLMYPPETAVTFMRRTAATALKQVAEELKQKGLALKIFDAYRPYSVTVLFWELVKDERYVANPSKGSGHNRGIAVDLTIIDTATGKELNMGTGFDNFSDTAHQTFKSLPEDVLQNRYLLRTVMEKNGFKALETEWWHYFLADGAKYEILDIDFKRLMKLDKN